MTGAGAEERGRWSIFQCSCWITFTCSLTFVTQSLPWVGFGKGNDASLCTSSLNYPANAVGGFRVFIEPYRQISRADH